ncbi:hypothetical protein NDU88_004998 [Pleurodeles waltl]|uniref:Uncharacterized protein n=1 Tax=Pleurodeles waltl TaxID=8319 RepID=A0AAV7W972_PLEWA|nr:hypothetical protein NDU88_004998 [Pleurodeles waltl]
MGISTVGINVYVQSAQETESFTGIAEGLMEPKRALHSLFSVNMRSVILFSCISHTCGVPETCDPRCEAAEHHTNIQLRCRLTEPHKGPPALALWQAAGTAVLVNRIGVLFWCAAGRQRVDALSHILDKARDTIHSTRPPCLSQLFGPPTAALISAQLARRLLGTSVMCS